MCKVIGLALVVFVLGNNQSIAQQRRAIEMPQDILTELLRSDVSVSDCIDRSGGVNRTFKVEQIDVSRNDPPAIMVRGISPCVCSAKRCLNRIYRQTEDGFKLLFQADYAQEIEVQKDYTNSYRNLWAAVYVYSSFTSVLYEYRYDGQGYKWDHCLMRFYVYSGWKKGQSEPVRYHQRPEISWVGCNPNNP
jgi:hypothetical protein